MTILNFSIKRRELVHDRMLDQPGGRVVLTRCIRRPEFSYSGRVFHYQEELRGLASDSQPAEASEIISISCEAVLEAIKQSLDLLLGVRVCLGFPMQQSCRQS